MTRKIVKRSKLLHLSILHKYDFRSCYDRKPQKDDLGKYFLSNFRLETVSINILWGWFYCIVFKMLPLIKLAFEINILKNRYVMMVLVFIFFGTSSFALDVLEFSSKLPGRLQMRKLRKVLYSSAVAFKNVNDPWFKLLVFGQSGQLGRHVQSNEFILLNNYILQYEQEHVNATTALFTAGLF